LGGDNRLKKEAYRRGIKNGGEADLWGMGTVNQNQKEDNSRRGVGGKGKIL